MHIFKSIVSLIVILITVGCSSPDIDKIAAEYCECRKREHFEGKVIGEQCIKDWDLKYSKVFASKPEMTKLKSLMGQCNTQYVKDNKGASVEFAANEYCVCAHLEATNDTVESKFCFEEWNQKYKDSKLSESEQKEFVRIISECTGINDSIRPSEHLTIEMIAADYCNCIELGAQQDTVGSVACYQALSMQYQGLQLTKEEDQELKQLLKNCANEVE